MVELKPTQIESGGLMVTTGNGFTQMLVVSKLTQPLISIPATVYAVVPAGGVMLIGDPVCVVLHE